MFHKLKRQKWEILFKIGTVVEVLQGRRQKEEGGGAAAGTGNKPWCVYLTKSEPILNETDAAARRDRINRENS